MYLLIRSQNVSQHLSPQVCWTMAQALVLLYGMYYCYRSLKDNRAAKEVWPAKLKRIMAVEPSAPMTDIASTLLTGSLC